MSHVFKHPKYYEELRKRAKEEEASSCKQQAINETVPHCDIEEAASCKPQAKDSSRKRQASSPEQQASSDKPQAASSKISLPS